MSITITWQCSECENEDQYPGPDDLTLEEIRERGGNTMCPICGAPCHPVDVSD